jgi:hypothetical protein
MITSNVIQTIFHIRYGSRNATGFTLHVDRHLMKVRDRIRCAVSLLRPRVTGTTLGFWVINRAQERALC